MKNQNKIKQTTKMPANTFLGKTLEFIDSKGQVKLASGEVVEVKNIPAKTHMVGSKVLVVKSKEKYYIYE